MAYITTVPRDPLSKAEPEDFRTLYDYGCGKNRPTPEQRVAWNEARVYFLFLSRGPDTDTDYLWEEGGEYGVELFELQIDDWSYDPTNGTLSSGDILYTNRGFED